MFAKIPIAIDDQPNTWVLGPSGGEEADPGYFMGRGTSTGALAGGQIGADWQHGMTVFGVQGDLAWADIRGTAANPDSPVSGNCWAAGDQTASCGARTNWLGDVTVRAGILLHPDFLLYGKGGVAFDHTNFTVTGLTPGGSCDPQGPDYAPAGQTRTGWTAGVGGEKKFNPRVSGFLEYDYYDFGNKQVNSADTGNGCSAAFNVNIKQTLQTVKLRFNVQF